MQKKYMESGTNKLRVKPKINLICINPTLKFPQIKVKYTFLSTKRMGVHTDCYNEFIG